MRNRALAALALLAGLVACHASPRLEHTSADEFLSYAEEIRRTNSAFWVTYVGASNTLAYLEYGDALGSSGGGKTIVYWTELEGLPEPLATRLRSGTNPWRAEARGAGE